MTNRISGALARARPRAFAAGVLLSLLVFGSAAEQGAAAPDPVTCTGYSEPRVRYESQQWWTQDADNENRVLGDTLDGRDEHTHIAVCLPAPGVVVDGVVRFDLVLQLHEMTDGYVKRVRIQRGSSTIAEVNTTAATQAACLGQADCTYVQRIDVNMSAQPTGRSEFRFHNESERTDDSGALATNGWHICVRSCTNTSGGGQAVTFPVTEARGRWFETMIGGADDSGYVNARLVSGYPANADGLIPLSGQWCPHIRTLEGSPNEAPVTRSFVAVDPRFHDYAVPGHPGGYPGTVILDQAGKINGTVCIDTRQFTDGVHRLYIRGDGETVSGMTGGAFVVQFLVANGGSPPPPPPPLGPTVALTKPTPGQSVSGTTPLDASTSLDVVGVAYRVNGTEVARDTVPGEWAETWDTTTVANGSYSVLCRAWDASGRTVDSAPVTVTVANSTITWLNPTAGATVRGVVRLNVTAPSGTTRVAYLVDGVQVASDSSAPDFAEDWSSTSVANGTHTLVARAWNSAGQATDSKPLSFSVAN